MTGPAERARLFDLAHAAERGLRGADAPYIAAAQPTAILALLARLAALEAVAAAARTFYVELDDPTNEWPQRRDAMTAALRALDGTEGQ